MLDQKHQKTPYLAAFRRTNTVFALFLQGQGRKSIKNNAIYTVFKRTRRKHCVLRCFFNKGL